MVTKKKKTKKKVKKKKVSRKKIIAPKTIIKTVPSQTEKILVQNFVSLQKVMVNLSSRFDELSNRISKLLELFEISAKAIAEKDFDLEKKTDETSEILEKVNNLFEQNKVIARGVTLLHEKPSGHSNPPTPRLHAPIVQRTAPKIMNINPPAHNESNMSSAQNQDKEQYQKSLSTNEEDEDPFKDANQ